MKPQTYEDFIGNDAVKTAMRMAAFAAIKTHTPICHMLITGPPGVGKTTLARITAETVETRFIECVGNALTGINSVAKYILPLGFGGVIFIDEVHRVSKQTQDIMLRLIEDFKLQLPNSVISVPPLTVIASTTRTDLLDQPFKDRFPLRLNMSLYNNIEIKKIIEANLNYASIDEDALDILIALSRNTARIAYNLIKFPLHHYCLTMGIDHINKEDLINVMQLNKIYPQGLTEFDANYLIALRNGPLSQRSLIAKIGREGIDDAESFLIRKDFIRITGTGRELTFYGKKYISNNLKGLT